MHHRHHAAPLLLLLSSWLAACGGGGTAAPPSGATPPLISSFSPTSGAVGTSVTIWGIPFVPGATSVRFNGVSATVLSASTTSLVAVVPAAATTGRIQVSTAGGAATSGADFTVLTGLGAAWTTRLAGPRGTQNGLAWTGTRFAAVGGSAGFQASPDGLVWTMTSPFATANDLAWDGSLMVAVGSSGVSTSSDGLTWTPRTFTGGRYSVARSPATWVTVGSGGAVSSSTDAITWTPRTPVTTSTLRSVTWTGARFVAVGDDGAVVTSPDGVAWTLQLPPATDSFTAVGSSPSMVVATTFPYPGSQSALLTSPDGVAWTPRVPGIAPFNRVLYAAGKFVGLGFYSAATSADGLAWTTQDGLPGIPNAVVHTGSGWVAAGSDGNGASAVFSSSDGLTWSLRAADQDLIALARRPSDGLLVAVGSNTSRTSSDGGATWALDWLSPSLGQNYPFLDLVWSPTASAFIALVQVGANTDAYRSVDGRSWTRIAGAPCYGSLAVSEAGLLLDIGSSLTGGCVATSPDGATWTPGTLPPGAAAGQLRKAFWTGGQFVAVGSGGTLATSTDGLSWTSRASGVAAWLRGVAAAPSTLVVVGDGGTILTSGDGGMTWSPRNSGTSYSSLRRVIWTGSEFLAVGNTGRLLRSPDGVAWTTQPTPYTSSPNAFDLNEIAWAPGGGGQLVLVGSDGLIATSSVP